MSGKTAGRGVSFGTLAYIPPDHKVLDDGAVEMIESGVLSTALQLSDGPSTRQRADAGRTLPTGWTACESGSRRCKRSADRPSPLRTVRVRPSPPRRVRINLKAFQFALSGRMECTPPLTLPDLGSAVGGRPGATARVGGGSGLVHGEANLTQTVCARKMLAR